ncbi:hypothetical protein G7054_g4052 [Neopestalotiopsis clavispora]|nr:hypothetical protein G7054_g4052 [Neopestalotiopsis clavispora]
MFSQRRQAVPQKAGPADLRLAAVSEGTVQHPPRTIPRKPVAQRYDHARSELPRESRSEAPSWVSHDFAPRTMAQAPAQAPELRERSKEFGHLKSLWSSVYNRNSKKGKSTLDKASISAPINAKVPPRVSNFQVPSAPAPRRPGRTDEPRSVSTNSRSQTKLAPVKKPLPPIPSEWKTSNPVHISPALYEDLGEEGQDYARWSLGNWSLVADDGDQEPRIADWSSDEEGDCGADSDSECENDEFRRLSTEVVVNGESIEKWQLSSDRYLSFPEPSFEEVEERESTKTQRRRGMIFSSNEMVQLPDESDESDSDDEVDEVETDDLEGTASSEEPSVLDASFQSPEQEPSLDDEDSSLAPHLQKVEIKVTPPTPTRGRSGSLVHNEYLTPADAYKRIAEKSRKEAKRSREEADYVLYHCRPLMKALDIIKNDPEFAHLDSWEGAFEVLEMILRERKYGKIARQEARNSAIWFRFLYEKMLQEQIRLVSKYEMSHDFLFTTPTPRTSPKTHAGRGAEREQTMEGKYGHLG